MPRPTYRACLESGLNFDLNQILHGTRPSERLILSASYRWTNSYTGEETARASITVYWMGTREGRFRIEMEDLDQTIILVSQPRNFGGYQWYFVCRAMNRRCSVLWIPPGAHRFCSRLAWDTRRVAYASQFQTPVDRAHRGKARIKRRLIADLDPDEWDLPPKPKWMRWHTYNRHVEKFDRYEELLDLTCLQAAMRILKLS